MNYESSDYSLLDQNGQRKYLNQKERKRFYKEAKEQPIEIKLLCEMLFWTRARISEILNLKVSSIDQSGGSITIETLKKRKKGIFRQVPLPPEYLKRLSDYTDEIRFEARIWQFSRRTASHHIKKVMNCATVSGPMACPKGLRRSLQ